MPNQKLTLGNDADTCTNLPLIAFAETGNKTFAEQNKREFMKDGKAQENVKNLCRKILVPILMKYKGTLTLHSCYRCPDLNKNTPGASKKSKHMYGDAADLGISVSKRDNTYKSKIMELKSLIEQMIKNGEITVGELIDEHSGQTSHWVHVSLPSNGKTNKIFSINM